MMCSPQGKCIRPQARLHNPFTGMIVTAAHNSAKNELEALLGKRRLLPCQPWVIAKVLSTKNT